MKKMIALSLLLPFLTGCGDISRSMAKWNGHDTQCVDGVKYLQFPSGVTVKYGKDGKIETC